jgi:hypothetical protein
VGIPARSDCQCDCPHAWVNSGKSAAEPTPSDEGAQARNPRPRKMNRQPGRFSGPVGMVKMVRAGWGLALLAWPAPVLHRLGLQADVRSCVVARVLGCRHLVQATVLLLWPARRVQMVGVAVDVLHGASMAGLAVLDPMRRMAASTSAVDAGAWAAFGALSIRTSTLVRRNEH